MDDRWWSMREICEYLGVSHDTVSRWITSYICRRRNSVNAGNLNGSLLTYGLLMAVPTKENEICLWQNNKCALHHPALKFCMIQKPGMQYAEIGRNYCWSRNRGIASK